MKLRERVLQGIAAGKPGTGPLTVHVDVTNACNAACITCWDHSPLLTQPRSAQWKRMRMEGAVFRRLIEELDALGSLQAVILSGMGDPLVHPEIYDFARVVKDRGKHLTLLTNLVAADIERLALSQVDQLLVGVHGASARSYLAFHPGFTEKHFNELCRYLRVLAQVGTTMRFVNVIDKDNAHELCDMVRFGKEFGAARVNFKLASLYAGTEACSVDADQLRTLANESISEAHALAERLGVQTNLDLFEQQVAAAQGSPRATTPIADVGCYMGHVYTRITVEGDVLYCCNTQVRVGHLDDAPFAELWQGAAWQALRKRLALGQYFPGCDKCGKFEQNVKWSERVRAAGIDAAPAPRDEPVRLRVVS
ncbi:MAG: radical SAM protein [Polyangiaceae bacterium]